MRVLALVLLMIATFARADDGSGRLMRLTVKPVICIIDQRSPSCEMSFLVVWDSDEAGYYCIFNEIEPEPLRCWPDHRSGEMSDERTVQSDFNYWINQGADAPKLAVVAIEVLRMDSDDRRRRRRTRHVWDLL